MASSKKTEALTGSIILGSQYSSNGSSGEIQFGTNDFTTAIITVLAGTGMTAMKIKFQDFESGADFYRQGDEAFEVDEFVIPVTPGEANQKLAIRFNTRAMLSVKMLGKAVGGLGSITSIQIIRDGTSTNTPA